MLSRTNGFKRSVTICISIPQKHDAITEITEEKKNKKRTTEKNWTREVKFNVEGFKRKPSFPSMTIFGET